MQQRAHYADTFLPDFCGQGNLLRTMLIAELLAIAITAIETAAWMARLETLALVSLLVQWIAIVDIALLCLLQRPLAQLDDRIAATVAFVLLQLVTLAFIGLVEIGRTGLELPLTAKPLSTLVFEHLVVSIITTGVALRYFYVTAQWRRNVQAEAESRIQALQARIRPHFLFNSMNTIAELTRSDPAQAEAAVEDLAELFHVSLSQQSLLRLDEELAMVASYLRLERQRLGERLSVEWAIAASVGDTPIPPLTLQPLVENAVYHGIAQEAEGGRIRIAAEALADGGVAVTVRNPSSAGASNTSGHRMAQDNVAQRLRLALGERARMTTSAEAGDYIVRIHLPGKTS